MYNMAVIGDRTSILPYKAVGIKTEPVTTVEEARKALHRLADDDYAIIYMTEVFAKSMETELQYYSTQVSPAVILIPDANGSIGIGLKNIDKAVEKAVGSNIL